MDGKTALNLAWAVAAACELYVLGFEQIGERLEAIRRAEDRDRFRATMRAAGLQVPASRIVRADDPVPSGLRFPVILRPAFTLGGHGGGTARSAAAAEALLDRPLRERPVAPGLFDETA